MKRLFVSCVVIALVLGCDRRESSGGTVAGRGKSICTDTIESKALTCSRNAARRIGDTLVLRLDTGRDTTLVNVTGEEDVNFRYAGRIGRNGAHLIEQFGGDQGPRFLVMNARTGARVVVPGRPMLSPDATRFAAANDDWDCAEAPDQRLEVWRLTDSVPVREWKLEELHCSAGGTTTGWAAVEPTWRGNDTLAFTQLERSPVDRGAGSDLASYVRRPALAVRGPGGWQVVGVRK